MRAQWVCSRERRIALYKRSSINHSSTTVIVSVPFSIIPLLLSLYLSHSASFLYCCHCICPIQHHSSTAVIVSVPFSVIPLPLSMYLSHLASFLYCCHCICPIQCYSAATVIISAPWLYCHHLIWPILHHSSAAVVFIPFLNRCHYICPIQLHSSTTVIISVPYLSYWVLSFTAIVIATVPLGFILYCCCCCCCPTGFILYCHCRCRCPTWLYLLLPLLLPLSHWVLSFTAIVVTSVPLSIVSPPLSMYVPFSVILYCHCHLPCCFQVKEGGKLQDLVYNILPLATAIIGYSIGLEKLSADCFLLVLRQQYVCNKQIISGDSLVTSHMAYANTNKTKIVWIEMDLIRSQGACTSCLRACFTAVLLQLSY